MCVRVPTPQHPFFLPAQPLKKCSTTNIDLYVMTARKKWRKVNPGSYDLFPFSCFFSTDGKRSLFLYEESDIFFLFLPAIRSQLVTSCFQSYSSFFFAGFGFLILGSGVADCSYQHPNPHNDSKAAGNPVSRSQGHSNNLGHFTTKPGSYHRQITTA